jgi:YgiT-type zinc finger domain-containing protein
MEQRIQKEKAMKCVICKHGETKEGKVSVTLERDEMTLVFKEVPAQVCSNCGEEYVDEKIASRLLKTAEESLSSGIMVDIRQYKAA